MSTKKLLNISLIFHLKSYFKVRVSLRANDLLDQLFASEEVNNSLGEENRSLWRPEFASYMIEGTPGTPYGGLYLFVLFYFFRINVMF